MNKTRVYAIYPLLLILIALFVPAIYGYEDWNQHANAYTTDGSNVRFGGFSGGTPSSYDFGTYTTCTMTGSLFEPIITDFNRDQGSNIILVTDSNTISIYDASCSLVSQFDISGETIITQPTLNGRIFGNLIVLTDKNLNKFSFDVSVDNVTLVENISTGTGTNYNGLSCSREEDFIDVCWSMIRADNNPYLFNFTNLSREIRSPITPAVSIPIEGWSAGTSASRTGIDIIDYQNIRCDFASGDKVRCLEFNGTGQYTGTSWIATSAWGNSPTYLRDLNTFIAKVGGLERLFVHAVDDLGTWQTLNMMGDLTGVVSHERGVGSGEYTSNWMVGNYDKADGDNEAFYLALNLTNGDVILREVDFDGNIVQNINMTDYMNFSNYTIMADFNSSEDTFCLATVEGIFCPDSGVTMYRSGVHPSGTRNGTMAVTTFGGNPLTVYTDRSITRVTKLSGALENCGNGLCGSGEDAFNCPIDCGEDVNVTCLTSADCPTDFPLCVFNSCIFISGIINTSDNTSCFSSADCPYDKPICFKSSPGSDGLYSGLGVCISGYSSETNTTQHIDPSETATQSITDGQDNDFDEVMGFLFNGSSRLKLIIGILIILAITFIAFERTGNGIAGLGAAIIGTILVTVLGLIPFYILILVLISMLLLIVLSKFIIGSGSGGG